MTLHSEACERNKSPILEKLINIFSDTTSVLEIGSGTGQHAVHFATHLPHLTWHPTDLPTNLPGLEQNLSAHTLPNLHAPRALDVSQSEWPVPTAEALFTANTLHIMSWSHVEKLFHYLGKHWPACKLLVVYGPFRYAKQYTSQSNAEFDLWLKSRDLLSGIRDFEEVDLLAKSGQFRLLEDYAMPANNQLLVWRRR